MGTDSFPMAASYNLQTHLNGLFSCLLNDFRTTENTRLRQISAFSTSATCAEFLSKTILSDGSVASSMLVVKKQNHSFPPASFWTRVLLMSICVLLNGCGESSPIRKYTVDAEQEEILTSDLLRREFGTVPFDWAVPDSWALTDNDQFSKVAWQIGDKLEGARITVSDVSLGMGLTSQLQRWRGQVGIELSENENPMTGTEALKLGDITATYVKFHGPEQSILGMMLEHDGALWVFKLRGDKSVAQDHEASFREFCESVKIPA